MHERLSMAATLALILFLQGSGCLFAAAPEESHDGGLKQPLKPVPVLKLQSGQPIDIVLGNVAVLIDDDTRAPANLSTSNDGTKLVWVADPVKGKESHPVQSRGWFKARNPDGTWRATEGFSSPPFHLTQGMAFGGVDGGLLSVSSVSKVSPNLITIYSRGETAGAGRTEFTKQSAFTPRDFGFRKGSIMRHPRVSPDGKWLAFYTRGTAEKRGVMIHNLKTGQTFHLGAHDDKHPVWSPDGRTIVAHYQRGGNSSTPSPVDGVEFSNIAIYTLQIDGDEVVQAKRTLMDDTSGDIYLYQKHPWISPDGKYLFYHGRDNPSASSRLYVRLFEPGSQEYRLVIKMRDGSALGKSMHSSMAKGTGDLFFVGRIAKDDVPKGEKRSDSIYKIDEAGFLPAIRKAVGR